MGQYNFYAPTILGQEWVPIREELVPWSPQANAVEIGHGFTLATSRTLQDGRFYIDDFPSGLASVQGAAMAVYLKGNEAASGPVRRVVIPCNNGTISGDSNNGLRGGALSFADAMLNPSDDRYVQLSAGTLTPPPGFSAYFATNQYAQMLNGKRILGVNVLFTIKADADLIWTQDPQWRANFRVRQGNTSVTYASTGSLASRGSVDPGQAAATQSGALLKVQRLGIGQTNYFWQAPTFTSEVQPWTYADLQRFEISAASPISYDVQFSNSGISSFSIGTQYGYAALEVFFCEEQRLAVGAMGTFFTGSYVDATNILTMRHPVTRALSPVLPAGNYTTTFTVPDIGDFNNFLTDFPNLNGLRELYPIPPHPGVQLNVPFPLDESAEGQVFTKETTHILPQLSLHTSTGPLTEVHVYGRQAKAQVYGTITATQEIFDTPVSITGTASYPQVRFYARRFNNTTVPLTLSSPIVTGVGSTVAITPAAFDALAPEDGIIDGWKEVTLRFVTPPTMGAGTNPQWTWSATGETAGNRWEVLGAIAPALSGTPGNLLNLVPAPHQLSLATYGQPVSGATINLGWVPGYAPPVSATTDDQTSDAALLFSQDPPPVSGFAWTLLTQPITGVGLNCAGAAPCCVPTGIQYNRLTWTGALRYCDTFSNPAATGWGTSSCGDVWTSTGGMASAYQTTGTEGMHRLFANNNPLTSLIGLANDVDMTYQMRSPQLAAGTGGVNGSIVAGAVVRYQSNSLFYWFRLIFDPNQTVSAAIWANTTDIAVSDTLITHAVGNIYMVRVQAFGPNLKMKVWLQGGIEPVAWTVEATDVFLTTGSVGFRSDVNGANTAPFPIMLFYDNMIVNRSPFFGFNAFELQRSDSLTDWQTIMLGSTIAASGFNDYEARVGLMSSYRIRNVNVYNFAGAWSPTVTGIIPSPGITGGPCLNATGSLIFTSNANQTGLYNLAYVQIFENDPEEGFVFPEADTLQLRRMFRRDYQVAFKPTERGGEAFSRLILVQAAAVSPPKLANMKALRDMAWADLPYVCVRDEVGDRWFASVVVPSGRVLRNRRLYYATVGIVEVTGIAAVIDPAAP